MAMGMSYEQFWDGDCEAVRAFRTAHRLKIEQENHFAWWQGFYIHMAIAACLSDKKHRVKYPNEPYALNETEKSAKKSRKATKETEKAKTVMEIWAYEFNRRFQQKQTEKRGETDAGERADQGN